MSTSLPHTIHHLNCPACDASLRELLRSNNFPEMKFTDAARQWLEDTRDSISARTHRDHQDFVRRLNRFFGELLVRDIHLGHLKQYQLVRQGKCDPGDSLGRAGADAINHELCVLTKVLDAANLWKQMKPFYKRLKVSESTAGRALNPNEEERLILCAASQPRWKVAYWCSLLTVNTTAGPGEITHIRVKYINLRDSVLSIEEGLKNPGRLRHFPMTDTIRWVCTHLLRRYYHICERHFFTPNEDHFVLPGRRRAGTYDPWKPMGSWKKAWKGLIEKADLPGLRMYDLRHHAQTKMMEEPEISDHTIEDISGHVPGQTKKRYRHIRDARKLAALKRIEVKPAVLDGPLTVAPGPLAEKTIIRA